jgi:hypothetical protein
MTALGHIGMQDKRLITAILPLGRGRELTQRLSQEAGVLTVSHHHARGVGTRRVRPGRMVYDEKDVLMVLVDAEQADAVFDLIYRESGIGERHAGVMFQEKILRGHHLMPFDGTHESAGQDDQAA